MFGDKRLYQNDGMHGLYYANIPSQRKANITWLGPHKDLINDTNPYFLYTGTGQFEELVKWPLATKTLRKLKKKLIHFYLYEPGVYYEKNRSDTLNRSHYHEFIDNDIENIRCQEFDVINEWAKKYELRVKVITCDRKSSLLQKFYPEIDIVCRDVFIRGVYKRNCNVAPLKTNINKRFYCFNWRYTFHRHAAASFCTDLDCDLSWPFKVQESDIEECNWLTDGVVPIRSKTNELNQGNFIVDWESEKVNVDVGGVSCPISEWQPYIKNNEILKDYFCGIITETRFAQPFPNISEKVLNAVAHKTPFVLLAPPYTLEYMKELGFKTFNQWWDEGYDKIENHQDRLYAIKDVLEDINNQSLKKLNATYLKMRPTLEHNATILKGLFNDGLYLP